ncbi:MAG TPA: hypothetical protein VFE54_08355 [Mucilaginibacter sp.]|nr:hypothetical protein [Mucilaginibacter sp.]
MKRGLFSVFAVIIFCCFACKKEANQNPAAGEYLPLTDGSTWKYKYASDGGSADTLTIKMTGGTTLINGKTYYNAASTYKQGTSLGYFYAGNHIYATRTVDEGLGSIELQLLNDTASVGYQWLTVPTENGQLGGTPVQTINTIKEKNITRTLNGKTFNNVIHTQVQLQHNNGSGFATTVTYDFYLAKGIGLIENDSNTLDTLFETETLFDYTVK